MNLRKIGIVAGREYSVRVKKKSFIFTTILVPILFAALMIVPSLIMMNDGGEKNLKVVVADKSGIVAHTLESSEKICYEIIDANGDFDTLKQGFPELDAYALVTISPLDSANNVSVTAYSSKQINADVKASIGKAVESAVEKYKLNQYDIQDLEQIMKDVETKIKVSTYTFDESGNEKKSVVEVNMAISYIMSFLIYLFVFMFGNMVMNSVIEEKRTRIVEVIVSSVKPFDLMFGKITGVAGVALTQFFIWIVLTGVLVIGVGSFIGGEQLTKIPETIPGSEQIAAQIPGVNDPTAAITDIMSNNAELSGILSAIGQIDFPYVIGCFLIYFALGYLLYAGMFAAVGSAVENEADTNQLSLPITIPLVVGLFIMIDTFQHPDSALSFWASIIPFTSPMVMLARIPFEGGVPLWELLLSIGLLFVTFLLMVYLSGKIYRVGILMYGKKATFKDLIKWIKLK